MKKHIILAASSSIIALGLIGVSVHRIESLPKIKPAPVVPLAQYDSVTHSLQGQLNASQAGLSAAQGSIAQLSGQKSALCTFLVKNRVRGYDPSLCQ